MRARFTQAAMAAIIPFMAFGPAQGARAADAAPAVTLSDAFRAQAESTQAALTVPAARTLLDQAQAPLEKYTASALLLQAASTAGDLGTERKALTAILESGAAPEGQVAKFRYQAGILSLMLGDAKDAAAQLKYAAQLGFKDVTGQIALAEALYRTKDSAGGFAALSEAAQMQTQANAPVPEPWFDRAISLAVANGQLSEAVVWGQRLLAAYPTPENWRSAVMIYLGKAGGDPQQALDLHRLLAARDGLVTERDWTGYAALANQAGDFSEAKAALDTGRSKGIISADAAITKQIAALVPKSKKFLADLPVKGAAATKSSKGEAALAAADDYFAATQFEKAAEYYRMALSKSVAEKDRANVRLGVSLARGGDLMGGKAALAQVTSGPWSAVARFWIAWIDGSAPKA